MPRAGVEWGHPEHGKGRVPPPAALQPPQPTLVLVMRVGRGVLREGAKHSSVESGVQGEIDGVVAQVPKKILPGVAIGYSSTKLTLHVGEGFEFMKQNQTPPMLSSPRPRTPRALPRASSRSRLPACEDGAQEDRIRWGPGGCRWLHLGLIKDMQHFCRPLFPRARSASR